MLQEAQGNEIADHDQMAMMFLNDYKDRMGHSEGINMQFNLQSLLKCVEGLDELTLPFQVKEMDDVIKEMPGYRAPGPDGFNRAFLKKCWPIIKGDFY
jgi:hypothetical protein